MSLITLLSPRSGLAILATCLLAACSDNSPNSTSATGSTAEGGKPPPVVEMSVLERVQASGTLRVGYANEAPFAYMDSATGELAGEAPAILRHVAEQMGVDKIEAVLAEFGSLIPGLQANRFDLIAAGMYITPERCRQVLFSNPTYGIGSAFVVAEGNPKALHSFEAVAQHEDARLGVVVGAIETDYAQASGVPGERIVVFPDAASAMAGVQAGRVDAYAATALTVNDLLRRQDKGVERADPFTDPELDGQTVRGYGAFAFRQADESLRVVFDEALLNYLGSAEHQEAVAPYGFTAAELPGEVTAASLCAG